MIRAAFALVALSLPAYAEAATAPVSDAPRPVVTEIMAETPSASRSFAGVIAPRTEARLAFQAIGTMIVRDVSVGDHVSKGDVVARLNPEDLESNVRAAEAKAQAAAVQLKTARATASRTTALQRRDVASSAQLEQAQRALATAEAAASQAQSELARARDAERFAEITAPFDGVVTAVLKEVGMVVSAGDPVLTLATEDQREAVIDLPETLLAGLTPGTPFIVTPERDRTQELHATVDRIDPMADAATRTRRVHLALDGKVDLRLGALIRAHRADSSGAIITLPVQALVHHEQTTAVWVVTRNGATGKAMLNPVSVGPDWMGRVEVTSGLTAGQEVIVRGVNSVTDGQAVGRAVTP